MIERGLSYVAYNHCSSHIHINDDDDDNNNNNKNYNNNYNNNTHINTTNMWPWCADDNIVLTHTAGRLQALLSCRTQGH